MDDGTRTREINRFARELGARIDDGDRTVCEGPEWGERMRGLGFEMDCWESFDRAYGRGDGPDGFAHAVGRADDVQVLGNGIYSYWCYINHWAEGGTEDDYRGLRMMLSRLVKSILTSTWRSSRGRSGCDGAAVGPRPDAGDPRRGRVAGSAGTRGTAGTCKFAHGQLAAVCREPI